MIVALQIQIEKKVWTNRISWTKSRFRRSTNTTRLHDVTDTQAQMAGWRKQRHGRLRFHKGWVNKNVPAIWEIETALDYSRVLVHQTVKSKTSYLDKPFIFLTFLHFVLLATGYVSPHPSMVVPINWRRGTWPYFFCISGGAFQWNTLLV